MDMQANSSLLDRFQDLSDIPLDVSIELDRTSMKLGELMDLQPGSLITLAKPAGERVAVYVGDVLVGRGEVLLSQGRMAVRIADLETAPAAAAETTNNA